MRVADNPVMRDQKGAAGVELALALPVFVLIVFGFFQVAILLWAQTSLSSAVGQAARYATIYPTPDDDAIEAYARNQQLGIDTSKVTGVTVTRGVDNGRPYAEVEMRFSSPTDFIFFEGPRVDLTESRRAYLQDS